MDTREGWCGIPKKILFDDRLTPNQKLIYCYIESLTHAEGWCFASNGAIGKPFNLAKKTISEAVSRLVEFGYLFPEYENEGSVKEKRKLFTSPDMEKIGKGGIAKIGNHNNNILSNDNIIIDKSIIEHIEKKELNSSDIKKQRSLIISGALATFKKEVEKRKGAGGQPMVFVRNNKMDRVNISNLLRNEVVKQILDKKSFDLSTFITKIFEMADKLEWWKTHPIDNTSTFYNNYIKIMNQSKASLTAVPKTITEQERKAFLADF